MGQPYLLCTTSLDSLEDASSFTYYCSSIPLYESTPAVGQLQSVPELFFRLETAWCLVVSARTAGWVWVSGCR